MSHTLVYAEEAQAEVKSIFAYYEQQQIGLGDAFYEELDVVFGQIKHRPKMYQQVRNEVRRVLLKRFPFGVFSKILDEQVLGKETVLIVGIIHQSRNSENWPT